MRVSATQEEEKRFTVIILIVSSFSMPRENQQLFVQKKYPKKNAERIKLKYALTSEVKKKY